MSGKSEGEPVSGVGSDVLGKRPQGASPQPGELVDVLAVQYLRGELPGHVEFEPVVTFLGDRIDIEQGRQRHLRIARRGQCGELGGGRPWHRTFADTHPPEVVETDLRFGQVRELGPALRIEMTQHLVADAVARHRAQLLLHLFYRRSSARAAYQRVIEVDIVPLDPNREACGEPAHGAAEIGAGDGLLLAAVSLQRDQLSGGRRRTAPAPPLSECQHQGREQRIVGAAVETVRNGGEDRLGDRGRNALMYPARRRPDVTIRNQTARSE